MARLRMHIASYVAIIAFMVQFREGSQYQLENEGRRLLILAAQGYSVDLDCQISNYPYANVSLVKDNGTPKEQIRIPDGVKVTQSGQIFTINHVDPSDEGQYWCRVQSTTNIKINRLIDVEDRSGNYISSLSILPTNISIQEGESANFTCNATGKGIKSVEWYQNKKRISSTELDFNDSYIRILQLSEVTSSQAGSFECRTVFRSHLKGYRATTGILSVTEFQFLAKKRQYQRLFVGDPVTINCKTNDHTASTSRLWKKKNEASSAEEIVPNGGSITRRKNRFYFSSVTLNDAGLYTCKATLPSINKTIKEEVTSLLVFTGDKNSPQAQVYPFTNKALRGQDFNFSCQVPGDGISIKWLKNSIEVPNYQTHRQPTKIFKGLNLSENILMLKKLSRVDAANYTCVVTTSQQPGYSNNITVELFVKECLEPNEKYEDRTDASGYFECKQGIAVRVDCPKGKIWSQAQKSCTSNMSWMVPADQSVYYFIPGRAYQLDCRLNIPTVVVKLYTKDKREDSSFREVNPQKDPNIAQHGQNFSIFFTEGKRQMIVQCRAAVQDGKIAPQAKELNLEKAPDFNFDVYVEIKPSCVRGPLDENDSIEMKCHFRYYGPREWYKIDPTSKRPQQIKDVIDSGRIGKEGTLTLKLQNVTRSDRGAYVCSKSNGDNVTKNVTVFIDVAAPSPANISGPMSLPPPVVEGLDATFRCTVSGSPRPTVTWMQGSKKVAVCEGKQHGNCTPIDRNKYRAKWVDERTCLSQLSSSPTSGRWLSRLTVKKTQFPADAVDYTCVVDNGLGNLPEEQRGTLEMIVAPVLVKETKDGIEKPVVIKNQVEELMCTTKRSSPPANFVWHYQNLECETPSKCKPVKSGKWVPVDSVIGKIDQRSLNTSVLRVPGNIDFKYFKCTAVNPKTRKEDYKVYQFARREKQTPLENLEVKPDNFVARNVGDDITLTCEASIGVFEGAPAWSKDQKTIRSTQGRVTVHEQIREKSTSELRIQNASLEDSGLYVCSAVKRSDGRKTQKSIRLTVRELTVPTLDITPNVTKTGGQHAELFCNVTANPQPKNITWRRNGEIIQQEKTKTDDCGQLQRGFYEVEEGQRPAQGIWRLLICSVSDFYHTGAYRCEVENIRGEGTAATYLNILEKPTASVIEASSFENKVQLQCTATGNPPPMVFWQKENSKGQFVRLPKTEQRNFNRTTSFVEVELSAETYGTTYRCVANNSQGSEDADYTLDPKVAAIGNRETEQFSRTALIVVITASSFVILILILIIVVLYRRKKRYGGFFIFTLPPPPDYIMKLDPERSLLEQTSKLPYDNQWEFPRERLEIVRPLGSGAFGQVFLAHAVGIVAFDPRGSTKRKSGRRRSRFGSTSRPYYNDKRVTAVAIKSLKESAAEAEYRDLVSELKILIHIGEHKNIVNLLGACTKGREKDLWVIIEYCPHGNLLDFLRKRRDIFEATWTTPTEHADVTFTTIDLYICSLQVSRAMEFLTARRCVHRDLAARNVLVGEDYVLKVADFGLARDIYKEENYVKTTSGLLPVKWMAIEALVDRVYTHKSDVWSFGVLLWELFTLGGSPYPGLPANEVYQYLMEGNRMEKPLDCPDEMYEIMTHCWMHSPDDRPTFTDVTARLDRILEERTSETGEGYLDLEHAEDDANLDEPTFDDEYLDPGESLLRPPGSPTSEDAMHAPLPSLPVEEIELETFEENPEEDEKKKFILHDPPRERRPQRMDSELEKVRKDTLEREKPKESVSQISDNDFISEKEQLRSDDDDKDVCERNSGVFEYPPDYEHRNSQVPIQENGHYSDQYSPGADEKQKFIPSPDDVSVKGGKIGLRGRHPSNRYVKS